MSFINKPLTIDSNILIFSDQDLEDVHSPHDDAIVVKLQIFNVLASWVLVDNGLGDVVLFKGAAEKMVFLTISIKERQPSIPSTERWSKL